MRNPAKHLQLPPFSDTLPAPICFRAASMPADASYPQHHHPWGEFVYSFSGLMEIKLLDRHYLAPPQYGIWIPPNVEHIGMNRDEACHCSLYIAASHCQGLPSTACALSISPLVRSLLDHLRSNPPALPCKEKEGRLLQVLVDQLNCASCAGSYLPTSSDPVLGRVLAILECNPGDNRSLPELANAANTTERTLMRRCHRDLGMSFGEWRQRLRVVRAMPMLEGRWTVESIALELGYSSASAFIAMFRRLTGVTPDEFRKGVPTEKLAPKG